MTSSAGEVFLRIGAVLSFAAGVVHICIIFGGADWYRFFGAGEEMARAAEQGRAFPHIVTALISIVLFAWGAYALSGAGDILKLPLLKPVLIAICGIFLARATLFPLLFWHSEVYTVSFVLWSSAICLVFGLAYLAGLFGVWRTL